jgi:outer membrane lipopolysaccharide assembly protein LptE/RlpB
MVIVLMAAFSSCAGYRVAGRTAVDSEGKTIGVLPGDIKSVAVPFFVNRTRKPNVESVITDAVGREFMTSVNIVSESTADGLILGSINSYELEPVSFTANDVIQEYRLHIELSVSLVKRETKEVLWNDGSITDYEDFVVDVNDIAVSKDAEWDALKIISVDMARLVKERMLEGF